MPQAQANDIQIEYATFGSPDARPLLLLRGLGTQMVQWAPEFCQQIADAGHYLVIFDNRDVGLSTHFSDSPVPDMGEVFMAVSKGESPSLPYTLSDMADDVIGLMDALELETAHLVGISMGGMIVQEATLRHEARVRSLTSIMSSPSDPGLPGPTDAARAALLEPAPRERDAYIEYSVRTGRAFTGDGFPYEEDERRKIAGVIFDRAFDPEGVSRQAAAVFGARPRGEELGHIATPSLVIHGSADPLVPLAAGEATARAIPGAKLEIIQGMGHDLPRGAWDRVITALADHTKSAQAP